MVELFCALALVLVLEGMMPFISPAKWQSLLKKISQYDEKTIRMIGLISMGAGVIILSIVHQFVE